MVKTVHEIYRDYEIEGVPASGKHNPVKAEIREWGAYLESGPATVADTDELKTIDNELTNIVLTPDASGFDWRDIDSTRAASFDPNESVVVKKTDTALTLGAWYRRLKGDEPGVRDGFRAKGDGISLSNVTMAAGSAVLTDIEGRFTSADVGKQIAVPGAGPADALLALTSTTLVSTIAFYTSATSVTLEDAATLPVTNGSAYFSSDDTATLQDAINFMEFYPMRSRAMRWERGQYGFGQLVIPEDITGISFNGSSYWDANLICIEDSNRHAILNQSQEFKMFDLSFETVIDNTSNWQRLKNGLHCTKGNGKTADMDTVVNRCRIGGFYRGIYHRGRSLTMRGFNHIASCDYGIELDWPDVVDYIPGTGQLSDELGFRGNVLEGIRFHSMRAGGILNDGPNAHKAVGLDIKNIHLDIGRRIFKGHLGTGGSIKGAKSLMTPTPVLELTGGMDFNVEGVIGMGSAKGTTATDKYSPDNLVQLLPGASPGVNTGIFVAGRFINFNLANCEEHAVRDTSTQLIGVTFEDFTFHNVGFLTPANWRCFSFGSQNSDIEVINPKLVGTDTLNAIIGNNFSNNVIKAINPSRQGNTTPLRGGSEIIVIGKRSTYAPTIINVTNVAASTVTGLSWRYLDDDLVEIGGRVTGQATAASANCEMDIPLPVPSNFTQPYHAWGSLICATAGQNIAGSVAAQGANIRLRWIPPATTNFSFTFFAQYRIV